jgi:hypothetical protein
MMAKKTTRKSLRSVAPNGQGKVPTRGDHVSHHEIAARAYEIYLARGAMSGNEIGDWLEAERELCHPNSQG